MTCYYTVSYEWRFEGCGAIMKVSVVLSSYNGEQDIIEQLRSIDGQTRQPDEVLICDDCSTDGTVNLVQNYIEKKRLKNWKLVVNKKKQGLEKKFY